MTPRHASKHVSTQMEVTGARGLSERVHAGLHSRSLAPLLAPARPGCAARTGVVQARPYATYILTFQAASHTNIMKDYTSNSYKLQEEFLEI